MTVCNDSVCGHSLREHFGRPKCRLCPYTRFVERKEGRAKPRSIPSLPQAATRTTNAILPHVQVATGPASIQIQRHPDDPTPLHPIQRSPPMPTPTLPKPAADTYLPEEVFEAVELPKRKGVKEVLRAIANAPGIGLADLARRAGLEPRGTGAIVKALHRKGLLEVSIGWKDGKEERLFQLAGNLPAMLRAKAERYIRAADALDGNK